MMFSGNFQTSMSIHSAQSSFASRPLHDEVIAHLGQTGAPDPLQAWPLTSLAVELRAEVFLQEHDIAKAALSADQPHFFSFSQLPSLLSPSQNTSLMRSLAMVQSLDRVEKRADMLGRITQRHQDRDVVPGGRRTVKRCRVYRLSCFLQAQLARRASPDIWPDSTGA